MRVHEGVDFGVFAYTTTLGRPSHDVGIVLADTVWSTQAVCTCGWRSHTDLFGRSVRQAGIAHIEAIEEEYRVDDLLRELDPQFARELGL